MEPEVGMTILPTTAVADVVTPFAAGVAANIVPVLGLLGTFAAVTWVLRRANRAKNGKI